MNITTVPSDKLKQMQKDLESLRAQLAEKDKEIERLKSENRDSCIGLNDYFCQKLASAQAENAKLRESLDKLARLGNGELYGNSQGNVIAQQALSTISDHAALAEVVARAGEVMRERCAKKFDGQSLTSYASNAIRALPGVKLEDLK